MTVAEMKSARQGENVPFEAVLLVRKVAVKTAKNGADFLSVELGDKTGVFHVVCFENSANYLFFQNTQAGAIVKVQGSTAYYQDRFSPKLTYVDRVSEEELKSGSTLEKVVETSVDDPGALWNELQKFIAGISHEKLRETVKKALGEVEEVFRTIPAAVSMHHAYRFGLLEHTVRCARACAALLPLYPEVDASLAMSGVILHDIGKSLEYTNDLAVRKSRAGIMQGHVVLGYRMTRRAAMLAKLDEPLLERLEHVILSHQGAREWGAAVMAASPEAVLVAMVDNLDAKMGMVQYALRRTPPDDDFSELMPGLEAPVLVTPPCPPQTPPAAPDVTDPLAQLKFD